MADRYDLVQFRKVKKRDGTEQSYSTPIGVMFPMKNDKDGFQCKLHVLPGSKIYDGDVVIEFVALPPKPRDGDDGGAQRQQAARKPAPDLDDDIPF